MKKNEYAHEKSDEKSDSVGFSLQDVDFEWLFKKYYNPLCHYAKGLIKDEEEAKDIVSHFFCKRLEDKEDKYIQEKLSSYLYKCIKNACLDSLDKQNLRCQYCQSFILEHGNENWENPYDNDPLTMLIKQEEERTIEKAIEVLPEQCRKVFELVWYDGLIYQEVADRLCMTIGTVCKQIDRAKTKIRKAIETEKK